MFGMVTAESTVHYNYFYHLGVRSGRVGEHWTGNRVVLGSNPAMAISHRNLNGNSVYSALPVSFGADTKTVGPFYLVYAREMCNLSWTPPLLEKDNSKNNPMYNTQV